MNFIFSLKVTYFGQTCLSPSYEFALSFNGIGYFYKKNIQCIFVQIDQKLREGQISKLGFQNFFNQITISYNWLYNEKFGRKLNVI